MTRLAKYLKPYLLPLLAAIGLLYAQAMCDLALPDYMSDIVNIGILSGNSEYIVKTGVKMLVVSLLGGICTITVGFISARIAAGVATTLRTRIFEKVQLFSNAEFDKFSTASLITRTTNDITQIQTLLVMMIRMIFYAPIMGVGGFIHAIDTSVSMSWIIAAAVIFLLGLIATLFSIAMPKFKAIQGLIDKLNQVVRENLDGMLVIRAFNTQKFEEERFDKANSNVTSTNLFVNRAMATMMPIMMLIMNISTVAIIWFGAKQVSAFKLEVGDMMAYMQYAMQIIMSFLMMSMMFIMVPRAAVSADRIADVLDTEYSINDTDKPKNLVKSNGALLEFKNVFFKYPGGKDYVLHDISFTAKPGETTAIIGSTGSGKSTLVNLIPRFYDIDSGSITLGGTDIRDITRHDLREEIGYIPQKSMLFSGTIESNLRYARGNASDEEVGKAISVSQAEEFVKAKPDGVMSEISQGGTNVSGGQRQRLSIARALIKNAPINIFDDSFSALDLKTDAALRNRLKKETGNATVIIVAQRISTIMSAEQILVLDNGRIVGRGTHDELLRNCEVYKEIAFSQLSKEELAV